MSQDLIFHMCKKSEWEAACHSATYGGSSQDQADGFIHFSTLAQIRASAAKHRAGQTDLVLMAVDLALVGPGLKWEEARGGQLFPHVYNGLPVAAVVWVKDLPWDQTAGHHLFPSV